MYCEVGEKLNKILLEKEKHKLPPAMKPLGTEIPIGHKQDELNKAKEYNISKKNFENHKNTCIKCKNL